MQQKFFQFFLEQEAGAFGKIKEKKRKSHCQN